MGLRVPPGSNLERMIAEQTARDEQRAVIAPRRHGNVPTLTPAGEKFDSKLEARVIGNLRLEHGSKNVIRQVSIPLADSLPPDDPGRALPRIRVDALIIHERYDDGTFRGELVDAKGNETKAWTRATRELWERFALRVRRIKKG